MPQGRRNQRRPKRLEPKLRPPAIIDPETWSFLDLGNIAGPTLTLSLDADTFQKLTLTGDVTSVVFDVDDDNEGDIFTLLVVQDATGGRNITGWPANLKFPNGLTVPPLMMGANDQTIMHFIRDDINLYYIGPGAQDCLLFDCRAESAQTRVVEVAQLFTFEVKNNQVRGVDANFPVPGNVALSNAPTLTIFYTVTNSSGGNADARFQTVVRYVDITEQIDKAADETILQTEPVIDVEEELHSFTVTLDPDLISPDDMIIVNIERLGGDGADTYDGDLGIIQHSQRFNFISI